MIQTTVVVVGDKTHADSWRSDSMVDALQEASDWIALMGMQLDESMIQFQITVVKND